MIEITKACTVHFRKQEIPWLFDVERNLSIGKKKQKMVKSSSQYILVNIRIFFKAQQSCSWPIFYKWAS